MSSPATGAIVEARDVFEHFPVVRGMLRRVSGYVQAVDGVDLVINARQSIGLVGESGSGKSTLGRLITRLIEPSAGQLLFEGRDITHVSSRAVRPLRRHMQMVFQDPYTSLAPYSTVGDSVAEPLQTQLHLRSRALSDRVDELFRMVGLSPSYRHRYPHQFSGGQLQRISLARAISTRPKLIVLDEPVSSLDVSTQSEVINLLTDLRQEFDVAYLFIAHDLSVVRHVCDQIAVMYLGRIIEIGSAERVYTNPKHPYTQALLSAIVHPDPTASGKRIMLDGDIPSPINPPTGCRFHTRCPHAMDVCRRVDPPVSVMDDGTKVFCHLHVTSSARLAPSATPSSPTAGAPRCP